jgi:hypothetical protein
MKKCFSLLLFLFLFMPIKAFCEDTLKVLESYALTGEYLNTTIMADSATWQRGNTVYVLRKGGVYAWNAGVTIPTGWPTARLEFRSDYGAGYDPEFYPDTSMNPIIFFYPTATGGGAPPGQMASITAKNFTFKMTNINVSCYNERSADDTLYLRLANTMFMRTQTGTDSTTRIVLDSCIIKTIAGQIIRTEGATGIVKATNCIFADMGHPSSNFGAGKFIDARAVRVDTIWVENNTFINMYDRVIRHLNASAANYIGNFIFNHNTVASVMSYHGFLSLGRVNNTGGGTFQLRDNLFLDHFALGMDTAYIRQSEYTDPGELDRYGRARLAWVLTNANDLVQWDIQNNYYGVSDSGQAMLALGGDPAFWGPLYQSVDLDSIGGDPNDHNFLTRNMNKVLALQAKDTLNTFRKVYLKFEEYPGLMTELIRWVLNGSLDQKAKPTLNSSSVWLNNGMPDLHRHELGYYADTLSCSYWCDTDLSLAGTDGKIIGDTRWKFLGLVGVNESIGQVPNSYALDQNYPNPFNPSTKIQYSIPVAGFVTLKIYNLLGQVVTTLVNERQAANTYVKEFDASNLSSGIYFYQIKSGSFSSTKKMILMK